MNAEYPFNGIITRSMITEGSDEELFVTIYDGEMDMTIVDPIARELAQTSIYKVFIPLKKDDEGKYILPKKDDKILISTYDDTFNLVVENYMISQLGGITINVNRGEW